MRSAHQDSEPATFSYSPTFLTSRPWTLCDMSEATWKRLTKHGVTPRPLLMPGKRRWRIADIQAWLSSLPTRSAHQTNQASA